MNSLQLTEAWLKNPIPQLHASIAASLQKVDFTGPGSWTGQAALWAKIPGVPAAPPIPGFPSVALTAAAVAGAILLAFGLKIGVAMPAIPQPRLQLPNLPPTPELLLQLQKPKIPAIPQLPALDQPKLMKPLLPFIDLGKRVARGDVKCC